MNWLIILEVALVWLLQLSLIWHVLNQRTKSPAAVFSWILMLLFLPVVGALLYLLFGLELVHRKRVKLCETFRRCIPTPLEARQEREDGHPLADLSGLPEIEEVNGMPPTTGNLIKLLKTGDDFFPRFVECIRSAQHHVHAMFYIWETDETGRLIRDELITAARRGVQVRVLLDEIGSLHTFQSFFSALKKAGGRMTWMGTFSPLRGRFHLNLRNHRKLVLIDGTLALTGGMNVGDEYWRGTAKTPPYLDLHMEVQGPAVRQLAQHFSQDWYFATGDALLNEEFYPTSHRAGEAAVMIVAGGPDNDLNEIQLSNLALLHRARERLWMMTPYFVPEPPMIAALQLAAMRGVDVRLIVPLKCDHFYLTLVTRSFYEDLIPFGVRIYEYLPAMVHAKVSTIDRQYCMAGSANLDVRSLRINFELNLLMESPELVGQFDALIEQTLAQSREVDLAIHMKRGARKKMGEAIFRPFAPLL